jgi:signal recognition particle subunit SRP54
MGNLKDTLSMIPGANSIKDLDIDNDSFKHIEALIRSMTPKERSTPKIIDHSRKKRIARGAGRDVQEINALIKQFEQMSKMMKMVQSGGASKLMNMMKNFKQ